MVICGRERKESGIGRKSALLRIAEEHKRIFKKENY